MPQLDGFPTQEDVERAQEMYYVDTAQPISYLPSSHTLVARAGNGLFGTVYFCLPRHAITAARTELSAGADVTAVSNSMSKQLVAAKVCFGRNVADSRDEVDTLRTIVSESADESVHEAFFPVLEEVNCLDGNVHLFLTPTLPVICTLKTLLPTFPRMPEAFTWLIYHKLGAALTWLTANCTPTIVHGDLHPGNVLVGYPSLDPLSRLHLPLIKLIDFGRSLPANAETSYQYAVRYHQVAHDDQDSFLRILSETMGVASYDRRRMSPALVRRGKEKEVTARFDEFKAAVYEATQQGSEDHSDTIRALERRFGKVAETAVRNVAKWPCKIIWDGVMEVTAVQRGAVAGKVEELVREVVVQVEDLYEDYL